MVLLPAVFAQQPLAQPGGTVTGHVLCGDTQRPARFAQVMLFSVPAETQAPKSSNASELAQFTANMRAQREGINLVQTQTGADGSFMLQDVSPGEYYLLGALSGYMRPQTLIQAAFDAGADMKEPLPNVPIVRVISNRGAKADLTLQRGGVIAGRVMWDDGMPVVHARVDIMQANGKRKQLPPQFTMVSMNAGVTGANAGATAYTDDTGQYRIVGLAADEYIVEATVETGSEFTMKNGVMTRGSIGIQNGTVTAGSTERAAPLIVFAPAAFHKADAKSVKLDTAEEHDDEQVTINLSGLYTVSGQVLSAETQHGVNTGVVHLEDSQDAQFQRWADVDQDGNFSVAFVPPGTYTLHVTGAADTEPGTKPTTSLAINVVVDHTVRSYEDSKQDVTVLDNDVPGENIEVKPSKTTEKDIDLDELMKGLH
jgi:hypothetical protein